MKSQTYPMIIDIHSIKSPLMTILYVFMTIFSFIFILLFTFKPDIVLKKDHHGIIDNPSEPDSGKCVVGATLISILFLLVAWVTKAFR